MVIDTEKLPEQILGQLKAGADAFQNIGLFEVAVGLWTVAALLVVRQIIITWKKRKGYRMAVRERTTKETELLTEILNEGILNAEFTGKISQQRMKALFDFCSKKLDLPDLVPKETRLEIVKEQIKKRRFHSDKKGDVSKFQSFKNTKFSETVGEFANKFWKKVG